MDGNKFSKEYVLDFVARGYNLADYAKEHCESLIVSVESRENVLLDIYIGEYITEYQTTCVYNGLAFDGNVSDAEKIFSEADRIVRNRGNAGRKAIEEVNKCVDQFIENVDFATGIQLSAADFSAVLKTCVKKFDELSMGSGKGNDQ